MGLIQGQRYCEQCEEHTLHGRQSFELGWGCLLTILTGGLFIPIWLLLKFFEDLGGSWRCQTCGRKNAAPSWILWSALCMAGLFVTFAAYLGAVVMPKARETAREKAALERANQGFMVDALPQGPGPPPAIEAALPVVAQAHAAPPAARPSPPVPASDPVIVAADAEELPQPKPVPHPSAKKPAPRPTSNLEREFNIAKNLDKSYKYEAAATAYRGIIQRYPGAPQAEEAKARLKFLERD